MGLALTRARAIPAATRTRSNDRANRAATSGRMDKGNDWWYGMLVGSKHGETQRTIPRNDTVESAASHQRNARPIANLKRESPVLRSRQVQGKPGK